MHFDKLLSILKFCDDLEVNFVNLHNILPTAINFGNLVLKEKHRNIIEGAKKFRGADRVLTWPVPIGEDVSRCPGTCKSPYVFMGVDALGRVTGCRRVEAPNEKWGIIGEEGQYFWGNEHYGKLRLAIMGDLPLPENCKKCFANWRGDEW